ncbi:MAG: peptidyl-prolyl cis-trans isomerase [Polyangiaceae bacterium]|nr:peptidyl-prolyl cis-trans isomerase [Polyangiaceae bacterium]
MTSILVRVAREPLVHFLVIGALTFGIERAFGAADDTSTTIVVTAETRQTLAEQLERSEGRPPTDDELERAIQRWTDDELLYRAGLQRGLMRDDERVRERVAMKMGRILREGILVPEPTEDELRGWFAENEARFAEPPRYDFTQVFVSGDPTTAIPRANEILAELRSGGDPAQKGDTFSGGRRFRKRKVQDIEASFGEAFAAGLEVQAEGTWERLESPHGQHLVRVDKRIPGEAPDFEAVRADVRKQWEDEKRDAGLREALDRLRSSWSVVRE